MGWGTVSTDSEALPLLPPRHGTLTWRACGKRGHGLWGVQGQILVGREGPRAQGAEPPWPRELPGTRVFPETPALPGSEKLGTWQN